MRASVELKKFSVNGKWLNSPVDPLFATFLMTGNGLSTDRIVMTHATICTMNTRMSPWRLLSKSLICSGHSADDMTPKDKHWGFTTTTFDKVFVLNPC